MDRGWIKIYRSLLDWEWFDDAETVQLFIYLLVTANYEDKMWRGMEIKRGQTVIGIEAIAKRLKTTRQKIRTRLKKLEERETITISSTNRFTIVTICNYDSYQDGNEPLQPSDNQQITNRLSEIQPTDNQQNNQQITNKNRSQLPKIEEKGRGSGALSNQQITNRISGIQPTGNQQNNPNLTTTKEDKKIRSKEYEEEVAKATKKKRAEKKSKAKSGEDPKPTNTPKTQKEAVSEVLSGGVDRLHPEGKKTSQNANLRPSGAEEAKSIDYEAIKSRWNEETGGALGKLVMITGRRREMVRARIRETSVDDFFTMIRNAASSSFLRGESQRGWVANFDWCIKPNNYPKVLEGRYNDHEGEGVILPPNAKRVTDSSEGVDYRYIDFRELDKLHRR